MNYCYCICYIDKKYYKRINEDLKKRHYFHIRAIIPEVKVLRKSIRNQTFYEKVPVLFNYGFIKMPVNKAFSRTFLNKLKKDIPGIRGWLKSTESMFPKKKKKRVDNMEDFDDFSKVAICTREEVLRFKRIAKYNQKHSLEDILDLQPGQYVQLKIYPYEGVSAQIVKIDRKRNLVTVNLYPQMGRFTARIALDHVLYSVYKDYDPSIFVNPFDMDLERLESETVQNLFNTFTYE